MINVQNKQFAHSLPQNAQGASRLGVSTYKCSSSSDMVQFGGGSTAAPKFGADFKWDTEKFPPKRIFKFIGVGLMGIFGLHAGCHSYDINPNGTRSVVVRHGGNGPDKEVRGEGLVITFPPYMTTNVKYAINKQTVKETFQPLSRDGVRINGNGQNANTGVDIRLSFELDPGPDGKYDSVYQLNTKVLTSHPNLEYQNSSTAEFSTDDLITKALYFQEILPLLKNDIYTLSTVFPAEDFHNSRDFIQEGLKNGYRETIVEQDGTKREIEVKPLAAQLAPLGIKLNFVNVASIALPDFLKAELNKRAELPLARKNAELNESTNKALADAAREKAKIAAAVKLQQALGTNNAAVAKATGDVNIAKQVGEEKVAKAKGDAKAAVEKAKGDATALITEKKGIADAQIAEAEGVSTAAIIQAKGEAESVTKRGLANAEALTAEAKMLAKYPQLLEQMKIAGSKEAKLAIAGKVGLVLVDPNTPLDANILKIGEDLFKIEVQKAPLPATTTPIPPANK